LNRHALGGASAGASFCRWDAGAPHAPPVFAPYGGVFAKKGWRKSAKLPFRFRRFEIQVWVVLGGDVVPEGFNCRKIGQN